ncbi:MAG: DoxX family membrane protein [Porphyromonadaceae bacterium]|nr:DoxX family membrane protein [Porphyromonadaceae bacterium]
MPATLPTSKTQHAFRILLGLFLLYAGISHMTFRRADFVAQVPDWLTMSKDFVVLASGVVEMLLGLSLVALYRQRVWVGDQRLWARYGCEALGGLFFQPLLVLWALWSTGALKALCQRSKC